MIRTSSTQSISNRYTYKVKTDATGKIIKCKARLVAQDYSQKKNIAYFGSLAPVTNILTIRMLLTISVCQGWEVHYMNTKCAHQYINLTQDIDMELPSAYDEPEDKIEKLRKQIYEIKQSGRNSTNAIDTFQINKRFRRLKSDNCAYICNRDLILTIKGVP